ERQQACGTDLGVEARLGRLADLAASANPSREQVQLGTLAQAFDETDVGAALDDEEEPQAHAGAISPCAAWRSTSSSPFTCVSSVRAAAARRAPAASRARSRGSATQRTMAVASATGDACPAGARHPVSPSISQSGMPPAAKPTAGTPAAAASIPTNPNGSGQRLGTTSASASANSAARPASSTHPVNRTVTGGVEPAGVEAC